MTHVHGVGAPVALTRVPCCSASALSGTRAAYGLALLAAPDRALGAGCASARHGALLGRVLGARLLGQACLQGLRPRRPVLLAGSAVDLTHAATMLGLAVVDRRMRRIGLRSATTAIIFAAWGLAIGRCSVSLAA